MKKSARRDSSNSSSYLNESSRSRSYLTFLCNVSGRSKPFVKGSICIADVLTSRTWSSATTIKTTTTRVSNPRPMPTPRGSRSSRSLVSYCSARMATASSTAVRGKTRGSTTFYPTTRTATLTSHTTTCCRPCVRRPRQVADVTTASWTRRS